MPDQLTPIAFPTPMSSVKTAKPSTISKNFLNVGLIVPPRRNARVQLDPPLAGLTRALYNGSDPITMDEAEKRAPTKEEIDEESRRVRRLRIVVNLALNLIAQGQLTCEEAADLAAATRRIALQLFPGKEDAFDLIYRPKFQRLMNEMYRLQ